MLRRRDRAVVSPAALLTGYSDLEEIGGGAFATVYRAVESETGRDVALKILKFDTVHSDLVRKFDDEIRILAKVSDHPNIVTLYRTLTTSDRQPVLVLELCRESLAQRVRRSGPLDARETVRVGIKIAGALDAAHRHGFLHRDLKPQNILVTQFGEPALADFGVAALQASAQPEAGVFGFTMLHSAPEILEGRRLSPASDVYGLASTMYELLTGQASFAAFDDEAPAAVLLRILRDPVRPVRSESVPLDLSDLLEAAMAKEPERRPQSAAQFAEALSAVEATFWLPQTSRPAWGEGAAPGEAVSTQIGTQAVRRPAPTLRTPLLPPLPPSVAAGPPGGRSEPTGPSVQMPERATRNVVYPDGMTRGQPGRPLDHGSGRLPPLVIGEGSAGRGADEGSAARPLFVDPDEFAAASSMAAAELRADQAGRDLAVGSGAASADIGLPVRSVRNIPPAALLGMAVAALVVMAAILLILGAL